MVFGLGKKKEEQTPAPTQMSAEAMTMLTQMAQSGGNAQAAPMAPNLNQPEAAAAGTPAAMPEMSGVGMGAGVGAGVGAETPISNLTKKEQKALAREQKKAAARARKEEKERLRLHKKGAKSRFSRAKYLREANGNAAAGVALSCLLVLITMFGPIVINLFVLLPQTAENREIASRVQQYNDVIQQSAPLLQVAVKNKNEREASIQNRVGSFRDGETVAATLRQFIADLEARDVELTSETSRTIANADLGVAGLVGKTVTMEMQGDFLNYLLVRNKMVRAQSAVSVSQEEIVANPGDPIVAIKLVVSIPAQQQ